MLNTPQIERMLEKLRRFQANTEKYIFEKVGELDNTAFCHVDRQYHTIPDVSFRKAEKGMKWEGEGTYCWFSGDYTVPAELAGKTLFIKPHIGGYEAMLFVNGKPFGTFATKIVCTGHGNHYCDMIKYKPAAGEKIDIALEYYAGHFIPSCMPEEEPQLKDFVFDFNGCDICVKNYEIQDFYFDLYTVNQLAQVLPEDSFRKGEVINALYDAYKLLNLSTEDFSKDELLEGMRKAAPILKAVLAKKSGDSAPEAAIIGHSHMDTAWLWHVEETIKKCARTYSNQLNLMEQYPEYKFVQSSACHSDMLRVHYPNLFERIREAVKAGRYEPNGGVWVECDCNITSGESMVRQFLWGQRFTRKYFDYTSNCFWLPDTFGYSAAIPQIMKGCGVDYFLTTKISWNDTNKFPYDTFYWQGIDGTKVFTHFNTTHQHPDAAEIYTSISSGSGLKQKSVTNKRLIAFGFGDGGGGPQFEMIEEARRIKDTAGIPKTYYSTVGDFMKNLEKDAVNPNTYRGELYLELHRGTLTNQHTIKRNNRKSEFALRDLEFAVVSDAFSKKIPASEEIVAPLYQTLLINQFHDILPGTAVNRAHTESRQQTTELIINASAAAEKLLTGEYAENKITVTNTLSFDRNDCIFAKIPAGKMIDGDYAQQRFTDLDGSDILLISGVTIPAMSSVVLTLKDGEPALDAGVERNGSRLSTKFADITFDGNMTIASYFDKRASRELVSGENLNTLMLTEDLPAAWDNWDVDADFEDKFRPVSNLVSSSIVSEGPVCTVFRNVYAISKKSTVTQDMFVFADSPLILFDTAMDWQDNHKFLKAAFDADVYDDFARHEIQFGYVKRPTTRNTSVEQGKFEVVNHKYSDVSELTYGYAVLNDCKYGISNKNGKLRLSLHKGGNHPDFMGDHDGIHRCKYAFLPHNSGFSAESVIRPAYELNVPAIITEGVKEIEPLVKVDRANIIVEAVKACEDAENAYIVRVYESEGVRTNAIISFPESVKSVTPVNMLEEKTGDPINANKVDTSFRPFEIKTFKVSY